MFINNERRTKVLTAFGINNQKKNKNVSRSILSPIKEEDIEKTEDAGRCWRCWRC